LWTHFVNMTVSARTCQLTAEGYTTTGAGYLQANSKRQRSSVGSVVSSFHNRSAKTHFSSDDRCHTRTRPTTLTELPQRQSQERPSRLEDASNSTRRQRSATGMRQKTFRPSSGRLSSHIPPALRSQSGDEHYAGAKFCSDAPLASSLPRPPTHWLNLTQS